MALACGVMAGVVMPAAVAQPDAAAFPSRTVQIVVPFPPGGSMDALARQLAQQLSQQWGQSVVVDNRAGASGMIGLNSVAQSTPDGYTLGVVANSFVANPLLRSDMRYDAFKSFEPVSLLASVPFVLAVKASLPVDTLAAFVAHAKQDPAGMDYASGGNGTMSHMGGEMLKQAVGIEATHVPYRGQAPALTDVVAGHVTFTMGNLPEVVPHAQAGKVKALAIMSAERSALLPDAPTLAQTGHDSLEIGSWYGLVAPQGTPPATIEHIHAAIAAVLAKPDFRASLQRLGFDVVGSSPADFASFMRKESDVYARVIKSAGIQVQQ